MDDKPEQTAQYLFQSINDAQNRLNNLRKVFGPVHRPGKVAALIRELEREIESGWQKIREISKESQKKEGSQGSQELSENQELSKKRLGCWTWQKSKDIGQRAKCKLTFECEDHSARTSYFVDFSAEPYEGRHLVTEHSKMFYSYEEAANYCLELAESYAPPGVIGQVKRLKKRSA